MESSKWAILIFVDWLLPLIAADSHRPYTTIHKGIFLQALPDIVTCEDTLSLHFLLELPTLQKKDRSFRCEATNNLCQLVNNTYDLSDILFDELVADFPYIAHSQSTTANKMDRRGLFNIVGVTGKYLWGFANDQDVQELHDNELVIANREKQLEEAVVENQKYLTTYTKNLSAYSNSLKEAMQNNFNTLQQEIIHKEEETYSGEDALSELSAILAWNQYMLIVLGKLESGANECRSNLIPRSLLHSTIIQTKLTGLADKLSSEGFEFAVSLNGLWKIPSTNCLFGDKSVKVTINVPIRKKEHIFVLYEFNAIPYQFNDNQCILSQFTRYVAKSNDLVVPVGPSIQRHCSPEKKAVCMITQYAREPIAFSLCAEAVFDGSHDRIARNCVFECSKSNQTRINRISVDQYAITNPQSFSLQCNGTKKSINNEILHKLRSLLVTVPCYCKLVINKDENILHGPFPCLKNSSLWSPDSVMQIIPVQMSKLQGGFTDAIKYNYAPDAVDHEWTDKWPVLNLTAPSAVQFPDSFKLNAIVDTISDSNGIIYMWLLALTAVFILNLAFTFFKIAATGPVRMNAVYSILLIVATVSAEDAKEPTTVGGALWSLLKLFEITNILMIVFFCVIGVIVMILIWRIYRLVQAVYRMTTSLCLEMDPPEIRRRRN